MIKDILIFMLGSEAGVAEDMIAAALEVFKKHSQVSLFGVADLCPPAEAYTMARAQRI